MIAPLGNVTVSAADKTKGRSSSAKSAGKIRFSHFCINSNHHSPGLEKLKLMLMFAETDETRMRALPTQIESPETSCQI